MTHDLLVRLPDTLVEALQAEKARTGCPTSEFIRRAVIAALTKKAEETK
jgi:metal-responsive CopG/Arc/MetJ family transcriptional regulator